MALMLLTSCIYILLEVLHPAGAFAAIRQESSSVQQTVANGNTRHLESTVNQAVISALEGLEHLERNTVLDQIDTLQSLASEQDRLANMETALEKGFKIPLGESANAQSVSSFDRVESRQVPMQEQLASLPMRVRKERLQALISFGAEAHHQERELLQALVAEQNQLEQRAQNLHARHGIHIPALPSLPPLASLSGGISYGFSGWPETDTLLKDQALISTISSHEERLSDRLNVLALRLQRHVAEPLFSFLREPLKKLPLHASLSYLALFLVFSLCCFTSLLAQTGIFCVMLVIFAYFLLGRGFPADIDSPMVIDWCLRVLGCLYVFFCACVIAQICREYFCPPPPDADGTARGDGPLPGAQPTADTGGSPENVASGGSLENRASDHERVEANRQAVATAILNRAWPIALGALLLMFAVSITGLIVFVEGWHVWSEYRDEPCDRPLANWLLYTLIFQIVSTSVTALTQSQNSKFFNNTGYGALVGMGFYFWDTCTTCHETSPYLYHYVQLYLLYNLLIWTSSVFAAFGLVGLALWMQRMGLVGGGAMPAPGLIEKMETIRFQQGMQPAECCICQEDFANDDKIIVRTPCTHVFHKDCLGDWLDNYGRTCPLCRKDLEEAMDVEAPNHGGGPPTDTKPGMAFHSPAELVE